MTTRPFSPARLGLALLSLLAAPLLPPAARADGLLQKGDISHPLPAFQVQTPAGALVNGDTLVMHFLQGGTVLTGTGTFTQPDTTYQPGAEVYTFSAADMSGLAYGYVLCQPVDTTAPSNVINPYLVNLIAVNPYDAVRAGLTGLPNAAPSAAGGLLTVGTGAGQINPVNGVLPGVTTALTGTATGGTATSITLAAGPATADMEKGNYVAITGGTGAGQARTITAYNGGTLVAGVSRPWAVTPDATSTYAVIMNPHPALDSNLAVTAGTVADKAGYTASTVLDKTGYTATASNLPADYQQRGQPVSLPATAPAGYGSAVTDASVQADAQAGLAAQGYTAARAAKMDNADVATSTRQPSGPVVASSVTNPVTVTGPVSLSTLDETKIGSIGADTPGTVALIGLLNTGKTAFLPSALANAPTGGGTPQTGDLFGLLSPLVSGGKYTASALSLAPVPAPPADYLSAAEQAYLARLDAAVSSRLPASAYVPPANPATVSLSGADEAHLAFLDALVSSRLAASAYAPPPAQPVEFLSPAERASLGNLDAPVSGVPALSAAALLSKPVPGANMSVGQLLVLLGMTSVRPSVTNVWHADTHVLDTAYSQALGGPALLTTHAQYPTSQVNNPALSGVTAAVGAVPQP